MLGLPLLVACAPQQGPPLEVPPPIGAVQTLNVRVDLAFVQGDEVLSSHVFAAPIGAETVSETSGPDGTVTVTVRVRATESAGSYDVDIEYARDGEVVSTRTVEALDGLSMTVPGSPAIRLLVRGL